MPPVPPGEFAATSEIEATADIQNHFVPRPTLISIKGHQFQGAAWQYQPSTATYRDDDNGTQSTRLIYRPICPLNTNDIRVQTLTAADTAVFPPSVQRTIQQNQLGDSRDPRDWSLHSVEVDAETTPAGSWNPGTTSRGVPVTLAFDVQPAKNPVLEALRKVVPGGTVGGLSEQSWNMGRVEYV